MKSKYMLIVTMFLTAGSFIFSASSFVQASKAHTVVKQFVNDIQIMDIEPDEVKN